MRIAYVTFEYPPFINGGAGIHADHVTHELAKLGHEVVIFTPTIGRAKTERDQETNLKVRRITVYSALPFKALQFWIFLPGVIKKEELVKKFDIIHFNGISYGFLKRRIAHAPHVLTVHHLVKDTITNNNTGLLSRFRNLGSETGPFLSPIEKQCISYADKIVAVSNFTKDQIIKRYSIASDRIEVIYNGIDQSHHNFSHRDLEETRNQFGVPNVSLILFVGQVDNYRKGFDILVKAFEQVLKTIDVRLLVVGKNAKIPSHTIPEQIQQKIIFTGYVEEIMLQKFYALCDVYVVPSRLEGFGITIIEAFAAGKTVVATNIGSIPELIKHGKNGLLVSMNDSEEMADAIIYCLKNPLILKKIGDTNKKDVHDLFSWKEGAKKLEQIYGNL